MIIDLTYACKMGCSHCISDCKPEGENMSLQQLSFSYKNVSLLKYPLLTRSKHRRVLLGNQPSQDTGWGLKQHMPYPEIGIKYAGSEYTDPEGKLKTQDIGQMKFKEGMVANNKVTMKLYNSMHPGAKMGILCGNVRRKGKYHDMMLSLALPGEIIQNIVKMQHHCVSDGRTYAKKNFVPIVHENLIILQKPFEKTFYVGYMLPREYQIDIRNSVSATWRDVFRYVLYNIGGKAHYKEIAEAVKGYKKSEKNNNVEAKARQTLRQYTKTFTPLGNGYYKLVA